MPAVGRLNARSTLRKAPSGSHDLRHVGGKIQRIHHRPVDIRSTRG
jgi:hypothetical protein